MYEVRLEILLLEELAQQIWDSFHLIVIETMAIKCEEGEVQN